MVSERKRNVSVFRFNQSFSAARTFPHPLIVKNCGLSHPLGSMFTNHKPIRRWCLASAHLFYFSIKNASNQNQCRFGPRLPNQLKRSISPCFFSVFNLKGNALVRFSLFRFARTGIAGVNVFVKAVRLCCLSVTRWHNPFCRSAKGGSRYLNSASGYEGLWRHK